MFKIPSACALLFFLSASLHAFEFRVLSWTGPVDGLRYEQAGKTVALTVNERILSPLYARTPGETLEFFREVSRDGRTVREMAVRLTPPEGLERAILVLAPADAAARTFSGLWLDDSPGSGPANQLRFQNLSSHPVAIKAGGADLQLPSKGTGSLPFDAAARSLPLLVAARTDAGWELVSTQRQAVRDGCRVLVILRDGRALKDEYGLHAARPVELLALYDRPAVP